MGGLELLDAEYPLTARGQMRGGSTAHAAEADDDCIKGRHARCRMPSIARLVPALLRQRLRRIELRDGLDVCSGTGAGPTKDYYLNRPVVGADHRGGAMALLAAIEVEMLRHGERRWRKPR